MPVKITGEKGHPLTNQNNAAPKASHKNDSVMPSAGKEMGNRASVTRKQAGGRGTQYKSTERWSTGERKDGTPMEGGHMGTAMSGGPSGASSKGPKHGPSFYGPGNKFRGRKLTTSTSEMSQAIRRKRAGTSGGDVY